MDQSTPNDLQNQQDISLLNTLASTYFRFGRFRKAALILNISYHLEATNKQTLELLAVVSQKADNRDFSPQIRRALEKPDTAPLRLKRFLSFRARRKNAAR